MKFLVDATVLSEVASPAPSPRVLSWLRTHQREFVVNPIVLGEIEYGILQLPGGKTQTDLKEWFQGGVTRLETVDINAETMTVWASLLAGLKCQGCAMSVKDSLIAASALQHQLSIVTRNVAAFQYAGVPLINPFED